jgi:hypothetical protein
MKLGFGTIATMSALVLGLVIGSAKGTFDTLNSGLTRNSSKIILLDSTLAHYRRKTKDRLFRGLIKISSAPLLNALSYLGQ